MAVTTIASGSGTLNSLASGTLCTLDVGSGANRAIVVDLTYATGSTPVSIVVGGTDSLSLVSGTNGVHGLMNVEQWGGILTVTGTVNVVLTMTGTLSVTLTGGATSASGVDQTTPLINGTKDLTGSLSLAISASSGDLTVDCIGSLNSDISAPTQTQLWLYNVAGNRAGSSAGPGTAGPITHSWTVGSYLSQVAQCGCAFKSAAGGGGSTAVSFLGIGMGLL